MALVEINNLHKKFGDLQVLKGINMQIDKKEVVCLLGPSGGGKSTLLRCINLLERPTFGEIIIDDELITDNGTDLNQMRSEVGMVFQHFNLFPHLSVLQNCTLALRKVKKMKHDEADEKAVEMLKMVGLSDKIHSMPRQLSGGQQQRVAIARSLSMDPKLMLFDEPTSALDPELVSDVLDTMVDLAGSGMTMIVVTHEMGFARKAASRVCMLDNGSIIEDGVPENVFSSPQHPRTKDFLSKII